MSFCIPTPGPDRIETTSLQLSTMQFWLDKIEIIDQKFLESHMEFGGMRSTIERAKKTAKISIPSQWNTVIQTARTAAS